MTSADPIIRDSIALSVTDLATLTNANAPVPDPTSFTTEDGIVVNMNQTVSHRKLPRQEVHQRHTYTDSGSFSPGSLEERCWCST